jgi:hypothetical protein
LRVLEISVRPEIRRIKLTVEMPDPDRYLTSQVPHLPRRLFRLMPRLGKHTCHNDAGKTFRQECRETEIPHLFEHLIIELQLQAQQNPDDFLSGETEWNWTVDPRGRYHVTVDYENELLAVASIRLAARILASLDQRDVSLNIEAEVERLRSIMRLSQELAGPVTDFELKESPLRTWTSVMLAPPRDLWPAAMLGGEAIGLEDADAGDLGDE